MCVYLSVVFPVRTRPGGPCLRRKGSPPPALPPSGAPLPQRLPLCPSATARLFPGGGHYSDF